MANDRSAPRTPKGPGLTRQGLRLSEPARSRPIPLGGVPDGMDLSLICLDGDTLQFAGANHALYLLRSQIDMGMLRTAYPDAPWTQHQKHQLLEIPGDPQPIGKHPTNNPYKTHQLSATGRRSFLFIHHLIYLPAKTPHQNVNL